MLADERPDAILAQGDTTTVLATALAAFHDRIPFGHVEAGLRTGDMANPFPEEMNRVLASHLTRWHFAPTGLAADRLLGEGYAPDGVFVTGNTVIDALHMVAATDPGDRSGPGPGAAADAGHAAPARELRRSAGTHLRRACAVAGR